MVVEKFQRWMLRDYFSGATETLILIPKKNGKTTLMAALALYHMVVTPDAECVIAAASRDQAAIMLKQARGFIRRSPDLQKLMKVSQREIQSLVDDGRIRILASDEDTADGVIPTLAIVDELHRHKSAGMYGVFRDGLGPRNGRMITISTAGDDTESTLGLMRRAAYSLPTVEKDENYRYCRSTDGDYVMHEWALEASDNVDDLDLVKTVNPAPWQTIQRLRRRHDSPSMTTWQWARFACGIWLQGENSAVDPVEWAICGADEAPFPKDEDTVRIGLDLGWKDDTTALVPHWLDDDGAPMVGVPRILVPPRNGQSLRKQAVIDACVDMGELYHAKTIVLDPESGGEVIAQDLEDLGFDVITHSQKAGPMCQAAERLSSPIREGILRHPKDDQFTRQVLNARARRQDDGRWRFSKETPQSKKVIDGVIALAMVNNVAMSEPDEDDDFLAAWT